MLMNKKFQTISNYKTYNLHKNISTTNVYSSNIITSFAYKSFSDTQVTRKVSDTSNLAMESVKKYLLQCICPHILHIISSTASTCI
jgi:hypothetical protein